MTKYVIGYNDVSWKERCNYPDLLPLSHKRESLNIIFLLKYINGANNVDYTDEFVFSTSNFNLPSVSHGLKLQTNSVKTEVYKYAHFNRTIILWKNWLIEIRNRASLFKRLLNQHYLNKLDTCCPEIMCTLT